MFSVPPTVADCPSRSTSRRRCAGTTIVEVMVASTLLVFVILGALASISRGMTLTNHARMITLSSQVMQSVIEDLRLKNYSQVADYAAQVQPKDFTSSISTDLLNSNFTSTMTLLATFTTTYASTSTHVGLIEVVVTVTWAEGTKTYTRDSRTRFCEKGLSDYVYVGF